MFSVSLGLIQVNVCLYVCIKLQTRLYDLLTYGVLFEKETAFYRMHVSIKALLSSFWRIGEPAFFSMWSNISKPDYNDGKEYCFAAVE